MGKSKKKKKKKGGKDEPFQGGDDLNTEAPPVDRWIEVRVSSVGAKGLTAPQTPVGLYRGAFHWGQVPGPAPPALSAPPAAAPPTTATTGGCRFLACRTAGSASAVATIYDEGSSADEKPHQHLAARTLQKYDHTCAELWIVGLLQSVSIKTHTRI